MSTTTDLLNLVKDKRAYFVHYRAGNLIYRTQDGFEFPVPVSDTDGATFPAEEKASFFLRWIRKQMELIEKNRSGAV